MTERLNLVLHDAVQGHQMIQRLWQFAKPILSGSKDGGKKLVVEIKPATRTLEQNARLWAMLTDVSEQVDWYGRKLTPEDWKHIFTAALKKQDSVPGIDGGIVVLGQSTRRMTKKEMADLQTLMEAFGAERGVVFREPEGGQF